MIEEKKIKDLLGNPIYKGSKVLWFKANSKEPPALKGTVTEIAEKTRGTHTIQTIHVDLGYRITKVNNTDRLVVIDKLLEKE